MPDGKGGLADSLLAALGPGWEIICDPNMWRRWRLMRDGYMYCCARKLGDLPRVFVRRVRDGERWNPTWHAKLFPIPARLRCGSVEELRLKLEVMSR